MQSILQSLNTDSPTQCPVCNKHLKTTQGLSAHLSSAKTCTWYRKGKLSELKVQMEEEVIAMQEVEAQVPIHRGKASRRERDPFEVVEDFVDRAYDLVPLESNSQDNVSGPSSWEQRSEDALSGFIDERVKEDPFPSTGRTIQMDGTLHEKWRAFFGCEDVDRDVAMDGGVPEEKFAPFVSKLDWRVARWAVQEGIGHKSLDHLLAIPGVSTLFLLAPQGFNSYKTGSGAPRPLLP